MPPCFGSLRRNLRREYPPGRAGRASGESDSLTLPFFYGWVIVAVAFVTMGVGVNARTAFSLLFPPILDELDRKSTRLNSSHVRISYAVFCLKKKKRTDY